MNRPITCPICDKTYSQPFHEKNLNMDCDLCFLASLYICLENGEIVGEVIQQGRLGLDSQAEGLGLKLFYFADDETKAEHEKC